MTQQIKACAMCKKVTGVGPVPFNMNYYMVCDKCADKIEQYHVSKGLNVFAGWALRRYAYESAIKVSAYYFGAAAEKLFEYDASEMVPMFTYGILKYPRNIVTDGGVDIVEGAKLKGFQMFSTGGKGFPVLKKTGNENDVVYGTFFRVPADVVHQSYDPTEGYSKFNAPESNMYNRIKINVELPSGEEKEVNMYEANESFFQDDYMEDYRIVTGNFDDRYTHMVRILKQFE